MFRSKKRGEVQHLIEEDGGLHDGTAERVSAKTGVPAAEVYGVGSFFHLLSRPAAKVRVCTGLSCLMGGAEQVLAAARAAKLPVEECSCLAACDVPPAVLKDRRVLASVRVEDVEASGGDWKKLGGDRASEPWLGTVGSGSADDLALHLEREPDFSGRRFRAAQEKGAAAVVEAIERSGLQGRGGAGFPAHIKWKGVRSQKETTRYVVLNADEGEPGTFKDREVMMRRPDLVLEGLAIAADAVGARDVYLYLRGEFEIPWGVMEDAAARFQESGALGDVAFHFHAGHGAYICGEETALLEALEGKRGMPRLKPPFPTEHGLWGKPTLVHNVETIGCVPAIVERGGEWFRALGKTEPGSKLYCVSGDVKQPGTYELPLGVSLDELVEAAGGYEGELKAFSPGGASSGFLPASERTRPLDFRSLAEIGSMLGSAGVVVLNEAADLKQAVRSQLAFFESESCGQCAPCRIGTRFLRDAFDAHLAVQEGGDALEHAADAAWQMNEGSICGLGQAAPLALTSAMKYFPDELGR